MTLAVDEDGVFVASCPSIPGCVSQGRTEADALSNLKSAIHDCLEAREELGLTLLVEDSDGLGENGVLTRWIDIR